MLLSLKGLLQKEEKMHTSKYTMMMMLFTVEMKITLFPPSRQYLTSINISNSKQ